MLYTHTQQTGRAAKQKQQHNGKSSFDDDYRIVWCANSRTRKKLQEHFRSHHTYTKLTQFRHIDCAACTLFVVRRRFKVGH